MTTLRKSPLENITADSYYSKIKRSFTVSQIDEKLKAIDLELTKFDNSEYNEFNPTYNFLSEEKKELEASKIELQYISTTPKEKNEGFFYQAGHVIKNLTGYALGVGIPLLLAIQVLPPIVEMRQNWFAERAIEKRGTEFIELYNGEDKITLDDFKIQLELLTDKENNVMQFNGKPYKFHNFITDLDKVLFREYAIENNKSEVEQSVYELNTEGNIENYLNPELDSEIEFTTVNLNDAEFLMYVQSIKEERDTNYQITYLLKNKNEQVF